ncbi:unnamed protein product [Ophioblennius macclurei]
MATCIPFQTQLSSIMEVLVKAAVAEISKLVDDKCAFLHLEISRKQSENDMLRRKLLMMERRNAQLQLENYMDRGSDGGSGCPHPAGDMKFPEMEDGTVSFTIKEESPDEALWISDATGAMGPGVAYPNPASGPDSQQFEENQQLSQSEASRQKTSDYGDSFGSSQHAVDIGGLQFTVKTEKEESRLAYGGERCQHNVGKHAQLAADFSMDERDNQLWSSIIEGNEIETGFPDFSSVVEEYSNTFGDHQEANVAKPAGVQQSPSQRLCNGVYNNNSDYQKEAPPPQPSCFQSRQQEALSQREKMKEQIYSQRNPSQVAHLRQPDDGDPERGDAGGGGGGGDRPAVTHSHGAYHPHKPFSGVARGYACSQCGKTFGRLHQYKLHQQSHKRKRAFWCTVCGKSFQCSSHLSIHHRTHTGEKPFGCGQCGKRFTQQSSLRVHQRTHSGERPYSCSQCGKTFILMHHLKRHRIIHTYS